FSATAGMTSYSWSGPGGFTATTQSTGIINSAGTYSVTITDANGCQSNCSRTLTVNTAATANAGSAQTVCAGGTVTLAGTIGGSETSSTWSAPSGTFSNASSLTSTYTPSIGSGTVTLTLTTNDPDGAGPCSAATSTVVITVNPLPTITTAATA